MVFIIQLQIKTTVGGELQLLYHKNCKYYVINYYICTCHNNKTLLLLLLYGYSITTTLIETQTQAIEINPGFFAVCST